MKNTILILVLFLLTASFVLADDCLEIDGVAEGLDEDISEDELCALYPEATCFEFIFENHHRLFGCDQSEVILGPEESIHDSNLQCRTKHTINCTEVEFPCECNQTYIFNEEYVVEVPPEKPCFKEICQEIEIHYGGDDCEEIIDVVVVYETENEAINSCGAELHVFCDCPSSCNVSPPVNLECGECICPPNEGFCTSTGLRDTLNGTSVYCFERLWLQQKANEDKCHNNFECLSNFCSNDFCYDISGQVEENTGLLKRIWNWLFGWI